MTSSDRRATPGGRSFSISAKYDPVAQTFRQNDTSQDWKDRRVDLVGKNARPGGGSLIKHGI